jgi:hypothetical protein
VPGEAVSRVLDRTISRTVFLGALQRAVADAFMHRRIGSVDQPSLRERTKPRLLKSADRPVFEWKWEGVRLGSCLPIVAHDQGLHLVDGAVCCRFNWCRLESWLRRFHMVLCT